MDPNEALSTVRSFVAGMQLHGRTNTAEVEEAAEAFDALDTWISNGGFLPEDWAKAQAR